MTEQYQVTIQGQLGPREGVLTLSYQESYITGSLDLVGYVNKVQGVRAADGTLHLFHPIQTVVSTIPCETVLKLQGACAEHLPQNPPRCGGKAHFSIKDPGRRRNCEQGNGKVILF